MAEKRKYERIPISMKLWCTNYHDKDGRLNSFDRPVFMDVYDMSIGGLGIICKHDFEENSILHFTLYIDSIPYEVMAMVRWSGRDGNYFKLGTMFVGNNSSLEKHLIQFLEENK